MATTWGTNTWGSNSWESDLNIITPSSNVITASSGTLEAYQINGWGGQFWGVQSWGNLTDAFATVTGQELTSSLGTETVDGEINSGWGGEAWGENGWGIFGDVLISGEELNLTVASVTVDAQIQIGWGGLSWGDGEWGDLANPDLQVSGIALTSNTEDVSIIADANVGATGNEITTDTDGAVAGTSAAPIATGIELSSDTDGVFAGELVTVELSSPSNDPWGNEVWGNGQWGAGDGTSILGDAVVDLQGNANVIPTGAEATGQTGDLGQASIYNVTNGSENSVEFTAYNQAQLSTAQAKFGTASLLLDGTNDYVESNSMLI